MSGDGKDSGTDTTKLDQIIAQLTTLNTHLDRHDARIARTEKFQASEDLSPPPPDPNHSRSMGGGEDFRRESSKSGDDYRRDSARLPKINFPRFDGSTDPLPWLNQCESYFRGMRTLAEEKVWIASVHLDGTMAEWFYALQRDNGSMTWPCFVDFVNLHFGPSIRSNPMAELKELSRTSMVEEYQRQFSLLICRCEELMPRQ